MFIKEVILVMDTIIITQSGVGLNSRDNWTYSINLDWIRYKTVIDGFDVNITAKKSKSENEITILSYNRERGTVNSGIGNLNKAYTMLQSLLNAIENGDKVWDAREQET